MTFRYYTMSDTSTERALELLNTVERYPEQAAHIGRKALRWFEHSHWLRFFPTDNPPWGCAYTTDPRKRQ